MPKILFKNPKPNVPFTQIRVSIKTLNYYFFQTGYSANIFLCEHLFT